jgi:hypothetical protein
MASLVPRRLEVAFCESSPTTAGVLSQSNCAMVSPLCLSPKLNFQHRPSQVAIPVLPLLLPSGPVQQGWPYGAFWTIKFPSQMWGSSREQVNYWLGLLLFLEFT